MSRLRKSATNLLVGLLAGAVTSGGLLARATAQCAMCKESAYDQHDAGLSHRLGLGFNTSVYGMLGVLIVLLAGLVVLIRMNLRAQARRDRSQESGPLPGES